MIDIDPVNQKLYWATRENGEIGMADMDGSNSMVLFDDIDVVDVSDIRVDQTSK